MNIDNETLLETIGNFSIYELSVELTKCISKLSELNQLKTNITDNQDLRSMIPFIVDMNEVSKEGSNPSDLLTNLNNVEMIMGKDNFLLQVDENTTYYEARQKIVLDQINLLEV